VLPATPRTRYSATRQPKPPADSRPRIASASTARLRSVSSLNSERWLCASRYSAWRAFPFSFAWYMAVSASRKASSIGTRAIREQPYADGGEEFVPVSLNGASKYASGGVVQLDHVIRLADILEQQHKLVAA